MDTLKLTNPIKINDKLVKELTHDANEITAQRFAEADIHMATAFGAGKVKASAAELDYTFHLYLGFEAIIAVNPEIDITDLERLKGADVMEVMRIGRNFIKGSGEASAQSDSGEHSEATGKPSTPPSESSEATD